MMATTTIEWTEASWNPVTGCTKISEGCRNCYAERMALRLKAMGQSNYSRGFEITFHENMMQLPLKWKRPQMIFVNSMSDLFHEDIPLPVIQRIFKVMNDAPSHTFQVLTKRSKVLLEYHKFLDWTPNIWMGVTVESQDYVSRIDDLRNTGAHVKFISFEPLLSGIDHVNLESIDWLIVGGESGPGARSIKEEWVTALRDKSVAAGIPFFFKQWGGFAKKKRGRLLDGREWSQLPGSRQFV
ncbi:MAG: phage Gp37/Gp68 family protein [Spirochaetaceae bacterium]|nr:MAG: phage Gp37/Gp68 family protein [Spirochaetaceae bacterium]